MKRDFLRPRFNLQAKVALVAVCALLVVAGALTLYYTYALEDAVKIAARDRSFDIAQKVALDCETGLAADSQPLLQEATNKALSQSDAVSAVVYDNNGQVVAAAGSFCLAECRQRGPQLTRLITGPLHLPDRVDKVAGHISRVCIPILQRVNPAPAHNYPNYRGAVAAETQPLRLGVVEIAFSKVKVEQILTRARHSVILIAIGLVLAVSLLISASTRTLIRPLRELLRGTKELAAGHLATRVAVTSGDEIGELAGAFNLLGERLQESHRAEIDHQRNLERHVAERTVELTAANTRLMQEIVVRKNSEIRLRETETKYRTLVEQLPAITYTSEFGREGRWHYVSPQVATILGFTVTEWQADPTLWHTRLHPDDRAATLAAEAVTRATGKPFAAEYRMYTRDGQLVWFSDRAVVIGAVEGKASCLHGVMFDITELKRMEQQFLQSQKVEAVGRLAAGVAHDFNNILTAIMGYSDLILRRVSHDDPIHTNAEQVLKAADRAAALTRQLLAFSRKQVLEPIFFNLNDIITDLEKMLQRLIGEDIQFISLLDPQLASVKADPAQITQVIMNLVVNARDAMPQGGTVTLQTANVTLDSTTATRQSMAPGPYVTFIVTDTGTGMTEEVKAHIFEPFFTTKPVGKGTGLGLATCFGIVQQSGGHIVIESEPGRGSAFRVYLPAVASLGNEPAAVDLMTEAPGGTEQILLVEDEPAIRELASLELRELGYSVQEASNGEQALELLSRSGQSVDLLVTDVVMPHMSGSELAEALRRRQYDTKVLFTSGYTADTISRHGVLDEGISFLRKPFTSQALARKVREVLDEK